MKDEIKKVPSSRTSQMESGHVVDNGRKVEKDKYDPRYIAKKVEFLCSEISEVKRDVEKIKDELTAEGGIQPSGKIKFVEKTENGTEYTDLGRSVMRKTLANGELKTKDLQKILLEHEIDRTAQSCRDWLGKIPEILAKSDLNQEVDLRYESGKLGGRDGGRQSRIVVKR